MVATEDVKKTVSQEDGDPNSRNPINYDLLQEGVGVKTSKTRQYLAAMIICLGAVAAGTALAWTSPVLPQITAANSTATNSTTNNSTFTPNTQIQTQIQTQITFNESLFANATSPTPSSSEVLLTDTQKTWVGSLLAVGALFGALPSGYIADTIGRRYTAMVMDVPFILAWLSISFGQTVGWLYVGRFLIGISTGSFCVVAPMYISEIAETSIRGSLGTLFQLLLTIGILFVYVVGAMVSWTTLSMLCLTIPILLMVGLFFLPETPVYLLKRGDRVAANRSLKWLWGKYCDSSSAIQVIQNDLDQTGADASIMDLFSNRASRNGLVISVLLMVFQQFSGINAVIFYTDSIFQSAGSSLDPSICSIIVGVVQVIMTLTSSLLIEKSGRKILLVFSSTVMTVCLAMLGAYYTIKGNGGAASIGWLPLICVVFFIVSFSVGYGPIPWMMMGELFLPDVKGTAVSLTVMINWVCVFLVTWCFGSLQKFGDDVPFWFFSAWMAVATVYVALVLQETKGKTASQIQSWLNGR
ncbi:facilitated trehalose transporter Tret1-2 homolog isoform X2 [Drosophila ficusphila]|uniref:facilitated trehalose transporter Tret1-2 homolog isoform X2 n=1 Tax=Drosophila ficusphila TaxID=30025 RepID=UPI0007E71945|nr:facilitated trehalose transporter Tret1-2 homolog isoform X2 [Drosophila ficusphila]